MLGRGLPSGSVPDCVTGNSGPTWYVNTPTVVSVGP